jgi:cell division protein ZapA
MATVNVIVNGRPYSVGCEDGQEAHVEALAREFDKQVAEVGEQVGQVGDLRLFLMAALVTADELADARLRLAQAPTPLVGAPDEPPKAEPLEPGPPRSDPRAVAAIESAAARIEALTATLAIGLG